jgi:UDP:flavonoid glycosyltransferase YjiC (YdhE family)
MIALGTELVRRGHEVTLETWTQWRAHVEAAGMTFAAAPEFPVFPRPGEPLKPYEAVVRSVEVTRPAIADSGAEAVVHDILTMAPAVSAELEGVPWATLVPHVHPHPPRAHPPYSLGARPARTAAGRALWGRLEHRLEGGLRKGRAELNDMRRRLGLPELEHLFGGLSRELQLVASFPQLEYPREWNPWEHVVGPMLWEPPADDVELPPGDAPLVLVAPSTAQDPDHRLLRATLAGLAGEDVRVLATWNRRPLREPLAVPANARLVEWVSYSRTMPHADVVVCHGGHGTVVRALASGAAVVVAPAAGDQAENAARVDWAGVGVRLPRRLTTATGMRLAVRRLLREGDRRARARELAAWAARHDGTARAADLVERLPARPPARRAVADAPTGG